ncbi:hypothetical protein BCR42DRAFT_417701 [Absidia repens]|uniref:Galactose oxidase n=1 Tax=Absidia repens TaxID=90262 RepID=A0A1X2IEL0_9FUNG|nr:hypothetical protein BCR42DRAFT_417701 [Absidia repens]
MIIYTCILLTLYILSSSAATVTPRAYLGCALVQEKIHCYGGLTGIYIPGSYNNPIGDHIFLDLETLDFNNFSSAQTSWTTNTGAIGADLVVDNGYQLATSMSNGAKFVVYGGFGPGKGTNVLPNPFLLYDPPTNTWSTLPTYGNYNFHFHFVV